MISIREFASRYAHAAHAVLLPALLVARTVASQDAPVSAESASAPKRFVAPDTEGAVLLHRYGNGTPVVTCPVLRACVVELEAGETLVDEPIAGDQARWIITSGRAGSGGSATLVIVKPKACDLTTNLVLSTDRRLYDVDLASAPCDAAGETRGIAWVRRLRYTYPDSVAIATAHAAARTDSSYRGSDRPSVGDSAAVAINRDYGVVRSRRGPFGIFGTRRLDFPWVPDSVRDDGSHVFIALPASATRYPAPVLYALEEDGSRTMLNYVMRDGAIVTDRVFRRGVLVLMAGDREQRLVLENRAWNAAPAGRGR